ncbi:nucleotidyltransferase domain-containing protein [Rubrivirga sp.]|uniref:nucleotidyltransferase domain-containing protein n=1 Tax=Rubrivirga sp. TaxID=1885344 RepID=UPI003B52569E
MTPPTLPLDPDVARVVGRVVEEIDPLRIVLFGSRALGTAGPNSDVDLLVVVPDGNAPRAVMRQLHERIRNVGVAVDYVVATPAQLDRFGESIGYIYREALVHGREVYTAATHA